MEKVWLKNYEPGVPHNITYPRIPLHGFLEEAAAKYPETTATIFPGRFGDDTRLSYRQLNELSNRLANAFLDMGVAKGDRVALLLPNCPQFVIAYYAALKAGATVVASNPLYSPRELEFQLKDAGAQTIVVLSVFYRKVAELRERAGLKNIIVTSIKEHLPFVTRTLFTLAREKKEGHRVSIAGDRYARLLSGILARYPAQPPPVKVEADDVALFQYTGGTTGTPKAAVATHFNLVANTLQLKAWRPDMKVAGEITLGVMPMFHVYGMLTVLSLSVCVASPMVLLPRFEIEHVLKAIDKYHPTVFPGVPTMYVAINNYPGVGKYNLRSIRACISGAAPLPLEVQQRFEELTGARLSEGYGLSESPTATHCNPLHGLRKTGTIGLPMPDVEAKIVDLESGEKEMPTGEPGELVIRGPQVMKGYWNRPEETARALRGGWLYTGDIAKVDQDGFFSIVDRKKEMIIAGGYNIYPREIEEVLYEHPKVKEAVAIGIRDPYRGETVKGFIVLKEGETATEEEIISFCQANLARYKVPRFIEFRKELPKTVVGKVLRRVLIEEERAKQK